ncbi:uncharacterized protein FPRO_00904 [Fusarium proliferatum ET1]|uniref:Uncharacterized protein n=1 Tax=Fusarium proliferatum (strain ET1) TaxID=1227346 RepID=A0A1L7V6R9_FUSPR|nr:uncharacterized protein FPRO_00904 [Fusarium proliferatum ET1]CZR34975.1 uncharacterized protein FPRO_00904 [Fusarium proliferatum ET1]
MAAAFQVQGWGSCFFFFLHYLPAIIILGDRVFGDIQSHQCALMDDSCIHNKSFLPYGELWHCLISPDSNGHWSLEVSSTSVGSLKNWKEAQNLPGYKDTSVVCTCPVGYLRG